MEQEQKRINVRVWSQNYDNLKEFCKERGITVTTAINMTIQNVLAQWEPAPKSEYQMYRDWLRENGKKASND